MSARSRKRVIAGLSVIFALAMLPDSALAKKKPAWVEHPERSYPRAEYMFGVGSGKDYEGAKAAATADLSTQFISVIIQTIKTYDSLKESLGKPIEEMSAIEVESKLDTSGAFEGIETRERFCCKSGKHYVLVVLETVT
jgi:hypothetical protein